MAKRLRRRKMKDGELAMYWGRVDGDAPDVVYEWRGDSSMRSDSRLLYHLVGCERVDPRASPLYSKMIPSLIDQLIGRGYDITTLKFSIMKKTDETPKA
jgi:hypothetical protein